jgi:hypothetical protein
VHAESENAVGPGEKVHVMTRRLHEHDVRRHFAGECTKVAGGTMRVEGYSYTLDINEFSHLR